MNGVIKVFEKIAFIMSILIGIAVAGSCSLFQREKPAVDTASVLQMEERQPAEDDSADGYRNYGSYLAGRVAHIRHDLNKAADFYKAAAPYVPDNQMISSQLYILLTAQGRIDEAVRYARMAREKGDDSPFIDTIEAINLTKLGQYREAIDTINKCDNPAADAFFIPFISAWNYAGLKEGKKALKALAPLASNPALKPLYLFHAGAINDYLGNDKAAEAHYTSLMNLRHMELAVFQLQVISNFYLRRNEPDKALRAASLAINKDNLMMKTIIDEIKKSDSKTAPILRTPENGLADALFSIALMMQQEGSNSDLAILFAALSSYCAPDYPLPLLFTAAVLEKRKLYAEAIETYKKVPTESYAYYTAEFQIAKNMMYLGKNDEAEKIFRKLYNKYPPNPDILTNLGEIARINQRYLEAARFYQEAADCYPDNNVSEIWPLYFAIGISYGAANDSERAEEYLRKVLKIRPNRITENHLGYTLLQQNKNLEEAFELIVSAYNPALEDGTVTDSLGWAFYKTGHYEEAVKYLEKASDQSPSEAVIYDHLGDAYWQVGRKREAVFQWNHALGLKDDSGEFNRTATLKKIKDGLGSVSVPSFDKDAVEKQIERLKNKEKSTGKHSGKHSSQ